jgi:hypothetical protein
VNEIDLFETNHPDAILGRTAMNSCGFPRLLGAAFMLPLDPGRA